MAQPVSWKCISVTHHYSLHLITGLFPSKYSIKIFYSFVSIQHVLYDLPNIQVYPFSILITCSKKNKSWSCSSRNYLHRPRVLSLITLFSDILNLRYLLTVWGNAITSSSDAKLLSSWQPRRVFQVISTFSDTSSMLTVTILMNHLA